MTDRSCRCSGCPADATAEDLLCDRCRDALTLGLVAVVRLQALDLDQQPIGPVGHYHVSRFTIDYTDDAT